MLGSSSVLALWLLAATPAGSGTAYEYTDDGLTLPASFQTPQPEDNARLARPLPPVPRPLPHKLAYEDKHLPPVGALDGIPGLPPVRKGAPPPEVIPRPSVFDDVPAPTQIVPKPSGDLGEATCDDAARCPDSEVYVRRQRPGLRGWLDDIAFESWLEQGVTINTLSPRDRSNGPVAFNNRSNEYQLNQAYLRLKRDINAEGDAWDLGGRIDLLYGSDSYFATSRGLETFDDFSQKWNAQQYGLALPQLYAEVFAPWGNGVSLKLGHFYSGFGYEAVTPLDNFFYSHSYEFMYGEPFSYTGLIGSTKVGPLTVKAGMTRGWDNWDDNNNDLGFVGNIGWTSKSKRTSISLDVDASRQQPDPSTEIRTMYALVFQQKLGEKWQYVIQHDYGNEPGAGAGGSTACWYGVEQYMFYTINERWKAGMRAEWFHDHNGSRVPFAALQTGDYFEISSGLNWTPNKHVVVRPELRWDWTSTPNLYPFGDGTRSNQLLLDCDVVMRF